ncbi:MAG: polysaccharide deacetylase family protein [Burkholderiaceae bacterium]|nr:polysaccharide deacetylase family protein [Burkholderiaceae bacterium]
MKSSLLNLHLILALGLGCCADLTLAQSATTPAAAASAPAPSRHAPTFPATDSQITEQVQTLLQDARQAQLLSALPLDDVRHAQALQALKLIKARQQSQSRRLLAVLTGSAHASQIEPMRTFLKQAAAQPDSDVDLLALRPVLNELRLQYAWPGDLNEQLQALFDRMRPLADTKSPDVQSAQTRHLAKLQQSTPVDEVLRQWLPVSNTNSEEEHLASLAREQEWRGLELPPHTVLLTFDDGPHPVHTPQILQTLAQHQLKAVFFQVGHNLGERVDGKAVASRNETLEAQIVAGGHAIGNHSYSHPLLSKLDDASIKEEIDLTQDLLDQVVPPGPARTGMFRAPYGGVNEAVLAETEERHLRLVLWNVDSLDWADPSPASIVQRVMTELDRAGRGIVLMHDIHAQSAEALPLLIKELKARGYHFAHWNGQALEVTDTAL